MMRVEMLVSYFALQLRATPATDRFGVQVYQDVG